MKRTLWTRDFTRITAATALGAAGGIISQFALSFLVFDETGSTLAAALSVAIQLIPMVLLPLIIAPMMDRLPRKPFLVWGDLLNGVCYAGEGIFLLHNAFSYTAYLAFSLLVSCLAAFDELAYNSFYPASEDLIKELGIDLNYNVEIETASVLTKSADTLIEQITTDRDLQRWLTDFVQERIDEGKKWDIRDGILTLGGELFKEKNKDALAMARSREELARIVGEATAHAAATKKRMQDTAAEAVRIIGDAGASVADFPYKGSGFAAYFYAVAGGSFDRYGSRAEAACTRDEAWGKPGSTAQELRPRLQPLLREMCALYDANVRAWNTCDLLRENYRSFALLADLYAKVQQMCDQENMMLLSETKYILSEFIGHNDAPFIYEKVGNRFEHFMIDEFQDTSVKEWENFLPLLQNAMAQSGATSVLIVGDIKQSIYRWRGGDWKILHSQAQQALGAESTELVNLKENYRSLPAVVDFNNKVIGRVVEADNLALNTTLDEAAARGDMDARTAGELRDTLQDAYREHAQTPRRLGGRPGYVSVETFAERPPVVERICEVLDKGFRPCDIMILVRGATDGAKVAAELLLSLIHI